MPSLSAFIKKIVPAIVPRNHYGQFKKLKPKPKEAKG